MVNKTQNRRNIQEKKKKKTIKRKRRGGKKKSDVEWEKGFWSEIPTIHAKFMTDNGKKKECGYSAYLVYHYLDEDNSIPLEKPKEEKDTRIQKRELLQILTNSKETDNIKNCALPETEVLELLKENKDFQKKVEDGKKKIKEMVEADKKQKELIKQISKNKNEKTDAKSEYLVGKYKEIDAQKKK